uniref:Uncharacterized protein n=1 Tax=Sphaerodactylus townsendi TaxID=933632 RepID=A0ACB8EUE9_9SAUR
MLQEASLVAQGGLEVNTGLARLRQARQPRGPATPPPSANPAETRRRKGQRKAASHPQPYFRLPIEGRHWFRRPWTCHPFSRGGTCCSSGGEAGLTAGQRSLDNRDFIDRRLGPVKRRDPP